MTQVKEMTNQQLNRALALKLGYEVEEHHGSYLFYTVRPNGKKLYHEVPDYCSDPAASLEVQTAAIAKDKDYFLNNLTGVVAGYFPQTVNWDVEWENDVIILLISASPRERAEAAYITLSSKQ